MANLTIKIIRCEDLCHTQDPKKLLLRRKVYNTSLCVLLSNFQQTTTNRTKEKSFNLKNKHGWGGNEKAVSFFESPFQCSYNSSVQLKLRKRLRKSWFKFNVKSPRNFVIMKTLFKILIKMLCNDLRIHFHSSTTSKTYEVCIS